MWPMVLPAWSGDTLDIVGRLRHLCFVPAYAIAGSGLLPEPRWRCGRIVIVVTGRSISPTAT